MKKRTSKYSIKRANARNSIMAVTPFRAVHLKIRRFQGFSDANVIHLFDVLDCFYHFLAVFKLLTDKFEHINLMLTSSVVNAEREY